MFQINWSSLINQNLPTLLRKPLRITWLSLLVSEVETLYNSFVAYRTNELYWLKLSGQKVYMEKMLNDTFDDSLRRIYIDTLNDDNGLYLYLDAEQPTANMIYVVWDVDQNYSTNDRVVYEGVVYEALADNQGFNPVSYPAYWELLTDELTHIYQANQFNNVLSEDFVINVPMGLVFDESYMRALVNRYKLADKTYGINYY